MKFLTMTKFVLLLTITTSVALQAGIRETTFKWVPKIARGTNLLIANGGIALGTIFKSYQYLTGIAQLHEQPDLPEITQNWARKTLEEVGVKNTDTYHFKIDKADANSPARAGFDNTIFFSPGVADSIERLLEDQQKQGSLPAQKQQGLLKAQLVLKHEASHVLNHDIVVTGCAFPIIGVGMHFAEKALASIIKNKLPYRTPKTISGLLCTSAAIVAAGVAKRDLSMNSFKGLSIYTEKRADRFANAHSSLEELSSAKQLFTVLHRVQLATLKEMSKNSDPIKLDDLRQLNAQGIVKYVLIKNGLKEARAIYEHEKKQGQTFEAWLENNDKIQRDLSRRLDPTHPYLLDRVAMIDQEIAKRKQQQ